MGEFLLKSLTVLMLAGVFNQAAASELSHVTSVIDSRSARITGELNENSSVIGPVFSEKITDFLEGTPGIRSVRLVSQTQWTTDYESESYLRRSRKRFVEIAFQADKILSASTFLIEEGTTSCKDGKSCSVDSDFAIKGPYEVETNVEDAFDYSTLTNSYALRISLSGSDEKKTSLTATFDLRDSAYRKFLERAASKHLLAANIPDDAITSGFALWARSFFDKTSQALGKE